MRSPFATFARPAKRLCSHQASAGGTRCMYTRTSASAHTARTHLIASRFAIRFWCTPHLIVEMTVSDLSVSRCLFMHCVAAA